jgi:hypothetical protein
MLNCKTHRQTCYSVYETIVVLSHRYTYMAIQAIAILFCYHYVHMIKNIHFQIFKAHESESVQSILYKGSKY